MRLSMTKYYISVKIKASFIVKDEYELDQMIERMEDGILGAFGVDEVNEIDVYDSETIPNEEGWLDL